MGHILQEIAAANRAGEGVGIYSCCSANEYVLRAALKKKSLIPYLDAILNSH